MGEMTCFSLSIVDDDLRELTESFNITLSDSDIDFLRDSNVSIGHTILTIQIDDNDGKY